MKTLKTHNFLSVTCALFSFNLFIILGIMPVVGFTQDDQLAVNFVAVTDRIHTSGQPDFEHLARLSGQGYQMVINLAPPASRGSIETEGKLVAEQGLTYVSIPVDWQNPQHTDFELFRGVLSQAGDRKVLIHCQMNMRVSLFTFLYRVVEDKIPPAEAYDYLKRVWEPKDQWAEFGNEVLRESNIKFQFP